MMTHTELLAAAVAVLAHDNPVLAPGTARIIEGQDGGLTCIAICDRHHDSGSPPRGLDPRGCCQSCALVETWNPDLATQLAALINARPSLAAWLAAVAEWGEWDGSLRRALSIARALVRGAGRRAPAERQTSRTEPPWQEMRCSECGRPLTSEPCGFVHAVARVQIVAIRAVTEGLFQGGRRG